MRRITSSLLVAGLALGGAACTSDNGASADTPSTATAGNGREPRRGELPPLAQRYVDFDPAAFDASSADVTNRFFPLKPGTRLSYAGSDRRGSRRTVHRVEIIVTDLVREIDGVMTTVVWERDFVRDALEEAELVYFAQDTAGNVWHLGQYSEVYEDDELLGSTGFLQGHLTGARAGIIMQADPRPGTPSYSQGLGPPPINWTDRGRVVATGRTTTVPAGTYDDVLVIEEYSEAELTAFQLKYYAPDVGNVRVGWRGDDPSQETLVLRRVETLDAAAMDRVRADAGELEERARMYGTAPAATVRAAGT